MSYVGRPKPRRIREEGATEEANPGKEAPRDERGSGKEAVFGPEARRSLRESKLPDAEVQSQRHGRQVEIFGR